MGASRQLAYPQVPGQVYWTPTPPNDIATLASPLQSAEAKRDAAFRIALDVYLSTVTGEGLGLLTARAGAAAARLALQAEARIGGEVLENVADAAGETSHALSTLRQTSQGEQFLHYGYAEHATNFQQGILPGGYGTTAKGLSGVEAQSGLALPHAKPPNAVYKVTPEPGTWIQVNPTAAPAFGQPGGLPEVQFIYGTGRGTVSGPFPIP